jgi:hypothetical protein
MAISPQPPAEEELELLLPPDPLRPEYSNEGPLVGLLPPELEDPVGGFAPPPPPPPPPDPPPCDTGRGSSLPLSDGGGALPPDKHGLAIACQVTEGGITGFGAAGGGLPGGT